MPTPNHSKPNNKISKDRILIPSDDLSRNIGEIQGGIFTKFNFQSSKHICRKHKAIGLDIGAFENYILPNASEIVCPDKAQHITYRISVALFKANTISDDLNWGIQLFCPLTYFEVERHSKPKAQMELNFGGQL